MTVEISKRHSTEKMIFEVEIIGKQLEKMNTLVFVYGKFGYDTSKLLEIVEYLRGLVVKSQQSKTYSEFMEVKEEYMIYKEFDKCKNKKQALSLLKKETKKFINLISDKIPSIKPKDEIDELTIEFGEVLVEFGKVINLFVNKEMKVLREKK